MIQQFHSQAYVWRKPEFERMHAPMFIAALFTITRTWKQLKCPLTEEWVKKMTEYYSAIKRNEIVSFADTWIDLEIVTQSEVSQNEKNKYCVISLKYGIQKNGTDELICKAEIESQMWRTNFVIEEGRGWDELGDWTDIYTQLYIKQIRNENLLLQHRELY